MAVAILALGSESILLAEPAKNFISQVKLNAAAGWITRSDATGRVLIFGNQPEALGEQRGHEFDFHAKNLRCRGTAFSIAEQVLEATRYYEFSINDQALMRFNSSCDFGPHPDGLGGADFYTKLIVAVDTITALGISVDDPLTIRVRLQPDNVVALIGTKP